MLTVDLFSVYLLSRFDVVIHYIEVYFMFGLPDYVRYIEEFAKSRFVISRFHCIGALTVVANRSQAIFIQYAILVKETKTQFIQRSYSLFTSIRPFSIFFS